MHQGFIIAIVDIRKEQVHYLQCTKYSKSTDQRLYNTTYVRKAIKKYWPPLIECRGGKGGLFERDRTRFHGKGDIYGGIWIMDMIWTSGGGCHGYKYWGAFSSIHILSSLYPAATIGICFISPLIYTAFHCIWAPPLWNMTPLPYLCLSGFITESSAALT